MNVIMEDIPYNLHTMVDIVGIENFLQICKMYGGSSIYIPVYSKMIMGDRNRRMVRDYNGKNIDRLRVRAGEVCVEEGRGDRLRGDSIWTKNA